jgi:hypothetical protein
VYVSVGDSLFVAISLDMSVGMEVDSDLAAWEIIWIFHDLATLDCGVYCEGGDG